MAKGEHTQKLHAQRNAALADSIRIIHTDSIVITFRGALIPFASYEKYLALQENANKMDLPALIITQEELAHICDAPNDEGKKERIKALIDNGYYRESFIKSRQHHTGKGADVEVLDTKPDHPMELSTLEETRDWGKMYDVGVKALLDSCSITQIPEAATHITHNGRESFESIYTLLDALDDAYQHRTFLRLLNEGKDLESGYTLDECEQHLAIYRDAINEFNQAVCAIEPLDREMRHRINKHVTKRLAELPAFILHAAASHHFNVGILPLQKMLQLGPDHIDKLMGCAEPGFQMAQVTSDVEAHVLLEEMVHLIDEEIGFSANTRFERAFIADTEAAIHRLDTICNILVSDTLIGPAGNRMSVDGKKPIYSQDEDTGYVGFYEEDTLGVYAEVLANLMHCEHWKCLDAHKRAELNALGIELNGNETHDRAAISKAVEQAVPHLWAVYKGQDGGPSFEEAVKERTAALPEPILSHVKARA